MKKKQTKKEPNYYITLKSVGRTYASSGATLEEAIKGINISGGVKAVSVLNVKKGDKEVEKILSPRIAAGLFGDFSPTMKMIALKKVTELVGI